MIRLRIRQVAKVLICMIIINNIVLADNNLRECIGKYKDERSLWIKDFHNIKNIRISKSKLLSEKYFGLDKACAKWKFDNNTLKEFFLNSKSYEHKQTPYRIFDQLPCVIVGKFTLENVDYNFEIQAGGSFEIWDNKGEKFYFGCDSEINPKCADFLLE